MNETELRRRISRRLRTLSKDKLRVADDFVAFLQERADNSATTELLGIPGFRDVLKRAGRQDRMGQTVRLSKVRRDV